MNKKYYALTAFLTLLSVGVAVNIYAKPMYEVNWLPNYDQALDKALDEHKRFILVYFHADPCDLCQRMENETFSTRHIADILNKGFVSAKLNAEEHADLARDLGVHEYPTFLFFTPCGTEVGRIVGYRPPDEFLEEALQITLDEIDEAVGSCLPYGIG